MTIDTAGENASRNNALAAFCEAASERELVLSPEDIKADGEWHRCEVEGRDDKAGTYKILFPSDASAGCFCNHADGRGTQIWVYLDGPKLSADEQEARKKAIDERKKADAAERERKHRELQATAKLRWEAAQEAPPDFGYLVSKNIALYGARLEGDTLLIPLSDIDGVLWNVQEIKADGTKKFPYEGRVSGLSCLIGEEPKAEETLVLVEGFATAGTVHRVTALPVLMCLNAGNLKHVAKAAKQKWPKANIVVAADDDRGTENERGINSGLSCALEAGGKVVVPDFGDIERDKKSSDFNDLARIKDDAAVALAFAAPLTPDALLTKLVVEDTPRALTKWIQGALAELKKRNPVAFERLRGDYRKAKGRVGALDGVPDAEEEDAEKETARQVDKLIGIARDKAKFFHTPKREPYADIMRNGVRETHPIRGHDFRLWLGYEYHQQTRTAATKDVISNAVSALEGYAQYEGEERDIFVRIGGHGGKIYIDLGDQTWRAIEIDTEGWRTVNEPPVRFRRSDGLRPLPEPARDGSLHILRPFLNVSSEAAFVLIVGWLVGALRNQGPYLILAIYGTSGAVKTTLAKLLGLLVDPCIPAKERLPRDRDTLILNASVSHVQSFDNISSILPEMSDDLCSLATGSGLTKRSLYTNDEQTIFEACRPIILNGIEIFVLREDLANRTATVTLEAISDEKRRDEATFWAAFEAARPKILGALLDVVSRGLRQIPTIKIEKLPRMADATKWIVACESGAHWAEDAAGKPIGFLSALTQDSREAALAQLATNRLAKEIRKFSEKTDWSGTVGELLEALNKQLDAGGDDKERKALERDKQWPRDSTRLSGRLRRLVQQLPFWGIRVVFGEHTEHGRQVSLRRIASALVPAAASCAEDGFSDNSLKEKAKAENPDATDATDADLQTSGESPREHTILCERCGLEGEAENPIVRLQDGSLLHLACAEEAAA